MLLQLSNLPASNDPVKVFYSYSHKDEELRGFLDEHLTILKREGFISTWHDKAIGPSEEWKNKIDENLDAADIILLLISSSFIASDYCYDIEMKHALKRHTAGQVKVIPIILRPVVWQIAPFAKLQALPQNGKPVIKWENMDDAFVDIAENIRIIAANVTTKIPIPSSLSLDDLTGQWVLTLENNKNNVNVCQIVENLIKLTNDTKIVLLGTANSKVVQGKIQSVDTTLILTGLAESFNVIKKFFEEEKLERTLGSKVLSFYMAHGATLLSSSGLIEVENSKSIKKFDMRVYPSQKSQPMILKGIIARQGDPRQLDFISDTGKSGLEGDLLKKEFRKLRDYFKASLTIKEEELWVNLSAYESNRMIPPILGGTKMGEDLLAQDCMLKQYTASLMHPDSESGKKYWEAVYEKANIIYGSTDIPINSFSKIWVVPQKAVVYENENKSEAISELGINKGDMRSFIVESQLDVLCEEDYFALHHNLNNQQIRTDTIDKKVVQKVNDFCIPIFNETILPLIKEEVNKCENFKLLRQIYHSMILATWFKRNFKDDERAKHIIDCGPNNLSMTILSDVKPVQNITKMLGIDESNGEGKKISNVDIGKQVNDSKTIEIKETNYEDIDNITPNDPAFKINENKEYYKKYIKLFRQGSFSCVRKSTDNISQRIVTRSYFSGALNFKNIPVKYALNCGGTFNFNVQAYKQDITIKSSGR